MEAAALAGQASPQFACHSSNDSHPPARSMQNEATDINESDTKRRHKDWLMFPAAARVN